MTRVSRLSMETNWLCFPPAATMQKTAGMWSQHTWIKRKMKISDISKYASAEGLYWN